MATLKNGLSRRSFLTLGGVAALGGAAALAGCAPQASSSANADAKGATDDAASAMQTADQTKECDIAIVGAGGAGMWAAVEAVRAGKSVVVIEKGGNVGVANGSLAGGPFMVGSKLQQEAGVEFTVEEAFNHIMEYAHWSTNAAAVKAAVAISGETVDQFTDDFGVPTGLRPDNYGAGHASVRANFQSDPKDSKTQAKGEDRMKPLQEFVESKGGEFLFNTAGKRLIMEDGACTGVQCEGDGVTDVKAKAVIVATGGFLGNVDMMREKFGTFVNPLGNVLSVGEGIDMVQAAGGQLSCLLYTSLQVFRLCGKFPRKTEALTRHFAFAAKRDDEARRSADEKPLVAHCHACHRVEKLAEPASFSTFRVRPYQWQTTTSPDWMMPKRSAADPTGRFTQPWLPRPCWYNVPPNAACQSASCRPMTLPTNGIQ